MRTNFLRLVVLATVLMQCLSARAESMGVTINVGAVVVGNCRIAVNDISFGAYDPLGSNASASLDTTSLLSILCTKDALATIALDGGANADASGRQMALGSYRLDYDLFRDGEHRARWSEGDLAVRVMGTGSLSQAYDLIVYGRIPSGQVIPAGTYSDVVTARVDF